VRIRLLDRVVLVLSILGVHAVALGAGSVTGVSAVPSPATAGAGVDVTLSGTGPCQIYLDFGDKAKPAHLKLLPGTVKHVYARPGTYVIRTFTYTAGNEAPGLSRCGGFADMELVVNPAGRSKAIAPGGRAASAASAAVKLPSTSAPAGITVLRGAPSGVGKVSNPAPSAGGAAAETSGTMRRSAGKATRTPTPTPTPTPGPK